MPQTGANILINPFKQITANPNITLFNPAEVKQKGRGFYFGGAEFVHHGYLDQDEMALESFTAQQKKFFGIFLVVFGICFLLNWHTTLVVTIGLITIYYFFDLLFNFYLITRAFKSRPDFEISAAEIAVRNKKAWPKYTVMCPLYKEWQVVGQFVEAMSELDYPPSKLQIMLLLEEDDHETIQKVAEFNLPKNFDVVVVPHSMPKTKPKALNYGLMHATGSYIVIYDAEDVPESLQLKKAVVAFEKAASDVVCIQAKLNFYNPQQNILTRIFAAEYALWFDLVLPGMQHVNGPIPLGGTSNHFRKSDIVALKGWDAFNVTEDCDLGIRLSKRGMRTAILDSTTMEEANSEFFNWYNQRSRWIKGYMQTYLVHMRRPGEFSKQSWLKFLAFQFIVAGKISSILINPLMWLITISYFAFRAILGPTIESFFPSTILYMGVFSLVLGNFLYLYYYMIGCAKRGYYDLIKYVFLVPFYWLFMSTAAWRALYEIFAKPHYWAKTKHGLHIKAPVTLPTGAASMNFDPSRVTMKSE